MNYYPFHIGDFRSGTVNMSRQSRWIYRDMLDIYYDTEKPLTLDLDALCDEIGAEADDERRIVERLLRFKFEKTEDGYRHEICERVIAEYRTKAETAKANGRLGGRPRKAIAPEEKPSGFQSGSDPVATGNPRQTGLEANQEPRTKNQEPFKNKAPAAPSPAKLLCKAGVEESVAKDWIAHRNKKRASTGETVIADRASKAELAGITLEAALKMEVSRGWQGFEAEWVKPQQARASPPGRVPQKENFDAVDYGTAGKI